MAWSELSLYLEAARRPAARTRLILTFVVIASILSVVSTLNSREGNWLSRRIGRLGIASAPDSKYLRSWGLLPDTGITSDSVQEQIAAALRKNLMGDLTKRRTSVPLSFVGVEIDTNDMALVAGIAFTLLLISLRYSLVNEERCTATYLMAAKTNNSLREAYDLLLMDQVILIPPSKTWEVKPVSRLILRSQLYLPLAAYTFAFLQDLKTLATADQLGDNSPIIFGALFWVSIVLITKGIHKSQSLIQRLWESSFEELEGVAIEVISTREKLAMIIQQVVMNLRLTRIKWEAALRSLR